jgi:hypothetical protein
LAQIRERQPDLDLPKFVFVVRLPDGAFDFDRIGHSCGGVTPVAIEVF